MVNQLSIIFMMISIALSIGLPVGLIVYFMIRKKLTWQSVSAGILVFMVSQIFLRIPLQMRLSQTQWYQSMMSNPLLYGLFLGLTAGLFEELGRYLGLKRMPKRRSFWDAVGMGLGHGGIEALIIGMQIFNNLTIANAINDGSIYTLYANADQNLVAQMIEILTTTESYVFLLSGIERVCTLIIQVSFTMLIMKAVRQKNFKFVLAAIALHFLVDAPLTVLSQYGMLVTEGYVVVCAVIAFMYIIRCAKEKWQVEDPSVIIKNVESID